MINLSIWWTLCAILVFLMQVGFMLLETGFVQQRSMSGIAIKNFLMLLASSLAYTVLGYDLMYGQDIGGGLIGSGPSDDQLGHEWQFYQTGFAAVTASIISGAIAERTTLTINILLASFVGGILYPIVGHWTWSSHGWLHTDGFHDLAGSGAVHFVGGMSAAAAAWIAGPRRDKYDPRTRVVTPYIGGRSLPLASAGVIFLWIGWMGFNGGSVRTSKEFSNAGFYILATCCAASAGGFSVMLISPVVDLLRTYAEERRQRAATFIRVAKDYYRCGGLIRPFDILPASMGGMVAITANSDLLVGGSLLISIGIGAIGGIVVFLCSRILNSRWFFRFFRIDDPVEAIAVHAGGGAAGILIAPALGSPVTDPVPLIHVQLYGLLAMGALAFASVAAMCFLLNGRAKSERGGKKVTMSPTTFDGNRPRISQQPMEEPLGIVHYWFPTDSVRSTPGEEALGLQFDPSPQKIPAFPLRTTTLAADVREDVVGFLAAFVAPPVHSLKSYINRTLSPADFSTQEAYSRILDALHREVEQMRSIADLEANSDPVSMTDILRRVHDEFVAQSSSFRDAIADCNAAGALKEPLNVQAQPQLLENAVRVLFSNAHRAAIRPGNRSHRPRIRYDVYDDGHRVTLSVFDNGGGVDTDVSRQLFRVARVKGPHVGGHGMGLFYAAWVASAFGGRLVLANNSTNETEFRLILRSYRE